MIAIERVCKFLYTCPYASGKLQTCMYGDDNYCGVFRTLSELQEEKKR
jgi:hypothetical protein